MATAGLLSIILGVAVALLALVWTWVAFDTGHSSKCGGKSRKFVRNLNGQMCGLCIVCIQTYLAVSIRIPTFSI